MTAEKPLLAALKGEVRPTPPLWLMRQAGRYLPEYREQRAKSPSFLDFCYNPAQAAEVTMQPIRRFHFDAAILFSDILVIPDALGQKVSFETGHGPQLEPIETPQDMARLSETENMARLAPVLETVDRVKTALPADVALIGFCGAPFTVASYMIAGHGTPDQAPARLFAYRFPEDFARLIDILVAASTRYLIAQIDAGAEVVQIFDSWAGVLPRVEFERWALAPVSEMARRVREARPQARIIAFLRNAGDNFAQVVARVGADGYSLDTCVDPRAALALAPAGVALQGNLDPLALLAGGAALERGVRQILADFEGRPHIFNLGHGVLPQTPIEHVETLVKLVRSPRS